MHEQMAAGRAYSPEVMISYSSHDRPQVMRFVQRLRAAGVAAWIDQGGIDGAQRWGEEIVNAIDACKIVILMISKTSMQSENIAKEVMLAWENGKHFLPLCLEDAKIAKSMQYQLAGIQHITLYEGDPEAKFVAVLRALVRLGVHVSPYYIALVSADLGEREQALEWLNRACEQRSSGLANLKTEPRFNVLRGDPRFTELVKRVGSLPLQEEAAIPDVPIIPTRAIEVHAVPAKSAPLWKRVLWPAIYDGRSARQAASQGVWVCGLLILLTILAVIFPPSPGAAAVLGPGWGAATAFLLILILGALGFGVQKMGRPAAVIGLVLCASGAYGNLDKVQKASVILDTYSAQYRQYEQYQRQYPQYQQYQNPVVLAYQQASSQYYASWFALLVSLISVTAFTNATRGTFGYHRMVMAHTTPDKQDAITAEDWAAIKAGISGVLHRSRAVTAPKPGLAPARAAVVSMPQTPRPQPVAQLAPQLAATALALPQVSVPPAPAASSAQPAPMMEAALPAEVVELPEAPAVAEPIRQGFAALIGVSGGLIYWPRVLAFWLANLAAGFVFLLGVSLATTLGVSAAYWVFVACAASAFTVATVGGFRFLSNVWAAVAAAAAATALLTLPFHALLPTFVWGDLVYREQFQQFILLPFVHAFVLLAVLVWVVPRLQPLPLALWLGAMGTEIAASLVVNLLHVLGVKALPDALLGSTSFISALLRSLVFALALWGGLLYVRKTSGATTAS